MTIAQYRDRIKQVYQTMKAQAAQCSRGDWLKVGAMAVSGMMAVTAVAAGVYVVAITRDLPPLPDFPLPQTTGIEVYDREGVLVGIVGQRVVHTYDDIPETFIQALLATEDRAFFEHPGVSVRGMVRAALANLTSADMTRQGGSTITMQTVRLITEDRSPSLRRKIREMVLAWHLERTLSKKEIMTLYTAICYLGEGQYGIEAASRHYFGIPAIDMSSAQAATLVAMLKAPNNYSRRNPERLKARRDLVLRLMADEGHLASADHREAEASDLNWIPQVGANGQATFVLDLVASELRKRFGNRFLSVCAEVHTTLDIAAQRAAQQAVDSILPDIDQRLGYPAYEDVIFADRHLYPQAGFVALDVADNGIIAWVGGRDYAAAPFNAIGGRGVAARQPGSSFKTFSYALAMSKGISPETVLLDAPVSMLDPQENLWSPKNYDSKYYGPMILKQMIVKSLNSMAVRLVNEHEALNPEMVAAFAQACGIQTPLEAHPSLPLGTVEVTPLEMASAYSVFARRGITAGDPYLVKRVVGHNGQVLFTEARHQIIPTVAMDEVTCFYTVDALKDVVAEGTAKRIRSMVHTTEVAGKTGTSTDYRDAWFVGLTPKVVTSVWVGFDDNRPMENPESGQVVVGGNSAAVMAGQFLKGYPAALQGQFWEPPSDAVIWFKVNPQTGEPDALNPEAIEVPYVLRSYMTTESDPDVSPPLAGEGHYE